MLINIFISIPLIQYGEFCRRAIYISSSVEHLTLIDLSKYLTQITLFIISFNLGFKSEKNILFIYSISSLSTILLSIKYIPNLEVNIKSLMKTFRRNWVISKWLLSTSVIQWIQNNYLLFLSNVLLGPIALGVIKVFQSILGISHIILQSISSWLPVKTSKELVNNPSNFKKSISKVILIFWIILSSIFILMIAFSKIILTIYDSSIVEYNKIFILYVFSYIIMSLNTPVKAVLVGIEKTFSSFLSIFLSASIIIILGYPLVKTLGISGTALTLISSQLIIFTINIFFLKRNLYKIQ